MTATVIYVANLAAEPEDFATELIAFGRDRLAHFKCPRRVDVIDELPRLDNGKLYRHRLREQYRAVSDG